MTSLDMLRHNDEIVSAIEQQNKSIQEINDIISTETEYLEGENLIDTLQNNQKNTAESLKKLSQAFVASNSVVASNVDLLTSSNITLGNQITQGFDNFAVVMGAVLSEIYNVSAQAVSDSVGETVVNVTTPAPVVNIDMASVSSSIDGLKSEINPSSRVDFYDKQNTIADYKTTSIDIQDLDGNIIATDTPLNIKTRNEASSARKTTDENNFELDDEDFDMWDTMPDISDIFAKYSYVDMYKEISEGLTGGDVI
jgi:hypothetical protein